MKLRSAIFVFVLLLLTATVCAAQSPMGFSPDEFCWSFYVFNNLMYDGPEYKYKIGDEETGAVMTDEESSIIHMAYSNDQVTTLTLYSIVESGNDDSYTDSALLLSSTIYALAHFAGEDITKISADEVEDIINSFGAGTVQEYWGYKFDTDAVKENNIMELTIVITK